MSKLQKKEIKFNIGCGKTNFGKDWIHVDIADYLHIEYDDIYLKKYSANSADLIYSSHTLEYFDREEVVLVLKEWKRVLKPDGILRLAVPNFKALVKVYQSTYDYKIENILGPLYGRIKIGKNKYIYHKTCYDWESLYKLLKTVGFREPRPWNWKNTEPNNKIDDCARAYWPHRPKNIKSGKFDSDQIHVSLNVECIK